MINDWINSAWAAVLAKLGGAWADLWSPISDAWPLWWSWGVFVLILLGCLLIGFFLQFKWARLALGVVVVTAIGWLFGRTSMYGEMRAKLDAAKAKNRPPVKPKVKQPDDTWRPFG